MKPVDESIESIFARKPVVRSRELVAAGVPRSVITRLLRSGRIKRISRGVYVLPDYQEGEHAALLSVARRSPNVVFCLLTSLRFHELTTQSPAQVWIAIPNKGRSPKLDYPPLRVVRYSDRSLKTGTITRTIDGITITLTGVEKTVADCFKFRNKIGLDVAIEALREARASKMFDADAFWRYAIVDRIANVVRPYLEALS
jgi:predicted transcriptional regulator of viral defense system